MSRKQGKTVMNGREVQEPPSAAQYMYSPSCRCASCTGRYDRVAAVENDLDDGDDSDYAEEHDAEDYIKNSLFKPYPVMRGEGPLYLGMELEVEVDDGSRGECAYRADGWLGDLGYLKEDGSLENEFEIVTHPMSFGWAMKNFPWRMLPDLQEGGCWTPDNTGIHIHLSRAGFTGDLHRYRWLKFIHRNKAHVTTFAGRVSQSYARFTPDDRASVGAELKGKVTADYRYRAVNLCNEDTFELRVFASSLDVATVQAFLAFADASVQYTRQLTLADIRQNAGWSWDAFRTWTAQRPQYTALDERVRRLTCAS